MVNHHQTHSVQKSLEFKERGNKCFQTGNFKDAEAFYTESIKYDPNNPVLYTNRSMALLKLSLFNRVISDAEHAISLLPQNMKAYFQLAQAQLALDSSFDALLSAEKAHKLCLHEIQVGGKGGSSIGPITELVLRCKKINWERKECEKEKKRCKLLAEVISGLEGSRDREMDQLRSLGEDESTIKDVHEKYDSMVEETRKIWASATGERKREVPEWCVDNITFSVMLDPVVTKTGQSYDRSSIMEHLKRSKTDPLTREPLRLEDLRPNLALRSACEEFLEENGWAVDW
ncbi:BgTH12-04057 [Blumeria graminis f. sp. triticale]|uniref:RING-type E3 ubiquitin transferase n=1 Tax=Blumeria graminis f. sp. triticale TaxID=1689686 RepID=A0A9W4D0Z3_BLUGR|nr:BgTH12-04057 [Blumeria graminis f. sp. triticale]